MPRVKRDAAECRGLCEIRGVAPAALVTRLRDLRSVSSIHWELSSSPTIPIKEAGEACIL
jgi:hypothetical protein